MSVNTFIIHLLTFTLLITVSISSDPSSLSPAPPPHLGSDDSPPPSTASPPSPPPVTSDLTPPSPSPSSHSVPSVDKTPTPSPAPVTADADVSSANLKNVESDKSGSSGMSGGKKAGIAIGVIAAACVVGFGGLLYKKRQQNIRRAEFSSAARREFL